MNQGDHDALDRIRVIAAGKLSGKLDVNGARVRRTSSRFCLGVEHGDYNGTELFGVGTDRFIWLAFKPNGTDRIRLYSDNCPDEGVIDFRIGDVPPPLDPSFKDSWARFPFGVDFVLRANAIPVARGFDAVLFGNIPGGGMSRSASLCINLILSIFDVNGIGVVEEMLVPELAKKVENDYIGSPCGILDQVMIFFARKGMGTHFSPATKTIQHIPLGKADTEIRLVVLDTGTVREGLENSTYKIRAAECKELVKYCKQDGFPIDLLADVRERKLFDDISARYHDPARRHLVKRLDYIFHAQQRFHELIAAWKTGDVATIGAIFRADGIGLRDDYQISGPELETMCDIVRTVPGVLGERMLGGGDKGAAGAIVRSDAVDAVRQAVETAYPRSHPAFAEKYAVHDCKIVDGVVLLEETI